MKIVLCTILLVPVLLLGVDRDTYRDHDQPAMPMMSRSDTLLFEDFDGVGVG